MNTMIDNTNTVPTFLGPEAYLGYVDKSELTTVYPHTDYDTPVVLGQKFVSIPYETNQLGDGYAIGWNVYHDSTDGSYRLEKDGAGCLIGFNPQNGYMYIRLTETNSSKGDQFYGSSMSFHLSDSNTVNHSYSKFVPVHSNIGGISLLTLSGNRSGTVSTAKLDNHVPGNTVVYDEYSNTYGYTASTIRFKDVYDTNIKDEISEIITKLPLISYKLKQGESTEDMTEEQKYSIKRTNERRNNMLIPGFTAEDLLNLCPPKYVNGVITYNKEDEITGFSTNSLLALIIAAIQGLDSRIKDAGI